MLCSRPRHGPSRRPQQRRAIKSLLNSHDVGSQVIAGRQSGRCWAADSVQHGSRGDLGFTIVRPRLLKSCTHRQDPVAGNDLLDTC